VGDGPTGVELSAPSPTGEEGAGLGLPDIDPRKPRIVVIEARERVLAAFPPALSSAASRSLERLGVGVRAGSIVTEVSAMTCPSI
jgi:NADH dehydrogenase